MTTLADFILARVSEDEAVARAAFWPEKATTWSEPDREDDGAWEAGKADSFDAARVEGRGITIYDEGGHTQEQAAHIARHDPARVLAECEARRRIVEEHRPDREGLRCGCCWLGDLETWESHPCLTLRALALPYASHPEYDKGWRP